MASFWGPFTALSFALDPAMTNAGEAEWLAERERNQNPMPIDPLNRNQFDASEYGLQTVKNDQTFTPDPGMTLQEMLAQKELQESAVPGLKQSDPNSLSFQYQPEFLRNYLGANPAIRDYEYDTTFYDAGPGDEGADPAFGQLRTEIGGSTSYPEKGDFYKEQIFDPWEEVPSLQRRLGNERFSLAEPQGIETINIEDAPQIKEAIYQDRIMNRNLPGFAYEPKQNLRSRLQNAKTNVGQKVGQGWDFAKQLPGMAMSALSGIPGAGLLPDLLTGMLPKSSPEQKAMMELYNSEDYQNLLNQIPGMANYNPVYGMGSGYGLTNAINKRLATLAKTRKRQGDDFSATLRKREEDLKKLLALEAEKDFARIGASGRRPGSGGPATHQDTAAAGGYSPGQAGAGTGGYSYDSGGRQGYGYGLKYGGRVRFANGGLASLFTRRG